MRITEKKRMKKKKKKEKTSVMELLLKYRTLQYLVKIFEQIFVSTRVENCIALSHTLHLEGRNEYRRSTLYLLKLEFILHSVEILNSHRALLRHSYRKFRTKTPDKSPFAAHLTNSGNSFTSTSALIFSIQKTKVAFFSRRS